MKIIIYVAFTLLVFIGQWKISTRLWGIFVPWNYKTDLMGMLILPPLMIIFSVIITSKAFKYIMEMK